MEVKRLEAFRRRNDSTTDRELIERFVEKIVVKPDAIEIHLAATGYDRKPGRDLSGRALAFLPGSNRAVHPITDMRTALYTIEPGLLRANSDIEKSGSETRR